MGDDRADAVAVGGGLPVGVRPEEPRADHEASGAAALVTPSTTARGLPGGVRLERLRGDHADAVLAFEIENREFFAARIADRGDDYFAEFATRHQALVDDQETGVLHFHVLVDDGRVIGRVNLVDVADGSAELGYRIAESATGRGLATAAVGELCGLAAREYGLSELRAGTNAANKASRTVLERNSFVQIGEPTTGDRPQVFYTRRLHG